ncbi:hypothetical protein JCM19236_1632 [Vibrio sp. JCM 19236]|nr:hypothetical protein JCM19236_1632 [Vibrio sp. JCM 19236]
MKQFHERAFTVTKVNNYLSEFVSRRKKRALLSSAQKGLSLALLGQAKPK